MKQIPVHWMIKIKERLEENSSVGMTFKNIPIIQEFIRPIIDYGNKEERRITRHFQKEENKRRDRQNDKGKVSKEEYHDEKVTV